MSPASQRRKRKLYESASSDMAKGPKISRASSRSRKRKKELPTKFSDRVREAYARLMDADAARKRGDLTKAIKICESLIDDYPEYVAALHTLGLVHMARMDYWPALSCFVRAAILNPGDWTILTSLAQAYLGLGANEMASRTLEQVLTIKDDDAEIYYTLGLIYDRQREYERAASSLKRALELSPDHALAALTLGLCQVHLGDLQNAAESFLKSHNVAPELLAPVAASAQLPRGYARFNVDSALTRVRAGLLPSDKDFDINLSFTRAHLLHKQGEFQAAWEQLRKANDALAARYKNELADHAKRREAAKARANAFKTSAPLQSEQDRDLPVSLYLLGPSRSGKTTLERVLGSIDGVKRGYENPLVELAVRRASLEAGLLPMSQLGDLPPELGAKFVDHYRNELRARTDGAKVFTNTHPGRISDVGRLANLIPNARFVFVLRKPEDLALRIYMKHFREGGNIFAYDLKSINDEIDWYHSMMAIWQKHLPDVCRTVEYERLVGEPLEITKIAAELCGLDATSDSLPPVGDDRNCAESYAQYLAARA